MKTVLLVLILLIITLFSCEELEHANPNDRLFILEPPSGLSIEVISDSDLRITWADNSNNEAGYKIERNSGSGFVQVSNVSVNITSYTDIGLVRYAFL